MEFKIKEVREAANMSQEELASISGVSRTIISGLESGRISTTTTETLQKIANALNKKICDVFFEN